MSHNAAIEALTRGFVIGVPTDTVYGIAADPANPDAVQRVFDLKGRSDQAPLVVLVATLGQASTIVEVPDHRALREHWPGSLTAVLRATTTIHEGVGDPERNTIAVRIPDHGDLRTLLELYGPLAVTSANRSGEPPAQSDQEAAAIFGAEIPVYIAGHSEGGVASTVADLTVDPPLVLRQGPVSL